MKNTYAFLMLSLVLVTGCDGKSEATVHVNGKIDVTAKDETQDHPNRFFGGASTGTIVGDEKKFDSKDF